MTDRDTPWPPVVMGRLLTEMIPMGDYSGADAPNNRWTLVQSQAEGRVQRSGCRAAWQSSIAGGIKDQRIEYCRSFIRAG
jgi:hypothetical protein